MLYDLYGPVGIWTRTEIQRNYEDRVSNKIDYLKKKKRTMSKNLNRHENEISRKLPWAASNTP